MPVATLAALDGGSVEIDSPLGFTTLGATRFLVAQINSRLQEFGASDLPFGDHVAEATSVSLDEEYSVQGGRLRLGSAEHSEEGFSTRTFQLGVWSGNVYCVKTFIYNRPLHELIDVFDAFEIEERGDGVVLTSRRDGVAITTTVAQVPKVVNNIPGLGLLEVRKLTPSIRNQLPPWQGLHVRGGQLFQESGRGQQEASVILLGASAVTRVYRDPALSDEQFDKFIDRASDLIVTWS
ncbi:MAG: hypothetical protein M3546_12515 [Actinomycetota bacterium]|nr:hypothetical protein [Actinomycetota bacterium]